MWKFDTDTHFHIRELDIASTIKSHIDCNYIELSEFLFLHTHQYVIVYKYCLQIIIVYTTQEK